LLSNHERIKLADPLDVFEFHNFYPHSYLIVTDSGGLQEEAPSFGVPVLVLRDTTERPEGIEAGTLELVGTDEQHVYERIRALLTNGELYEQMSQAVNPYGDGYASERIAQAILHYFGKKMERPTPYNAM
jgi:UDP-N-acetylglucosamine 2-epimerase (non-hydrolysing)